MSSGDEKNIYLSFSLKDISADPDFMGEALRKRFFKQDSWDFAKDVTEVKNELVTHRSGREEDILRHFSGSKNIKGTIVKATWYWDDDYYLEFKLDGLTLVNKDAKKSYGWKVNP